MIYHFKVHKEAGGGFWAEGIELIGCRTQADSKEALKHALHDALNLYLSEPEHSKLVFPMPRMGIKASVFIWPVDVDPKVAFAVTMRSLRLSNQMTQTQMKKALGMKHLSDYQRLEDPTRANPRLSTLKRIKEVFPNLRVDDILAA